MKNLLIVQAFHTDGVGRLLAHPGIRTTVIEDMAPAALASAVVDAKIIAVRNQPLTKELLDHATNLLCVAKHGVGVDKIDIDYLTSRSIPCLNTPGANAGSVAEQAITLMLAVAKKLRINDLAVRNGHFAIRETRNTTCISGKKILICGFGFIGRTVARMCKGFEMDVHFYDPFLSQEAVTDIKATKAEDFLSVLPEMDIISLHLPLTEQTRNMINAKALSLMKPEAILVSAARGGVVNEADLYTALKEGRIAGAGLDVFADEPTPVTNPLLSLDCVVTSPHNAALSKEGAIRMGVETAQNIIDFVEGHIDPTRVVNKTVLESPLFKKRWGAMR